MKTAAFAPPSDSPLSTEWLAGLHLHGARRAAASALPPEPACWRSEAFAEDLSDLLPDPPAAAPRQSLLRRALAAVLRR